MFKHSGNKAVFALLSVVMAFQLIWVPNVEAVESWKGNSWQGESWEGTPWDASDFIWEGDSWKVPPWNGGGTDNSGGNVNKTGEKDINQDGTDSSDNRDFQTENTSNETELQTNTANEDVVVEECLPAPGNSDCDEQEHKIDLSTEEKIADAVAQFEKENPYMFSPDSPIPLFEGKREKQLERLEQDFARLMKRPHGSVNDITIADNVMATLAGSGYSDGKLGAEAMNQNETFLADHGWKEIGTQFNDDSGFHARAFNQANDQTIVVSFAGTEDFEDGKTDAALAFGYSTKQFDDAAEYVEEIIEQYPDYQIILTGHSLGGAIAQYTALNTQVPAITWNAPGIGTRTYGLFENPLNIAMSNSNIEVAEKYFDENELLDDLIVNHMMEDDDIGTYHIHAGESIVYSEDGTSMVRDDYSDEAHKANTLWSLIGTAFDKGFDESKDMFGSHGLGNFLDLMGLC